MLTCHHVTQLLSEAQDRPLALRERIPLQLHMLMCAGCSNFRQQMTFLRQATRQYAQGQTDSRPTPD
jgi:hypothetical protein